MNRSKKKRKRRQEQELEQLAGIREAMKKFSDSITPEEQNAIKLNLLEKLRAKNKEFEEMQENDTIEESRVLPG